MISIPTIIANIKTPMIKRTTKLSFKIIKVVALTVVLVAIKKIKPLAICQPLELTIYINLIQAIIAKICV